MLHRSTLPARMIRPLALLLALLLLLVPRTHATGSTPPTPIWYTTGSLLTARTHFTATRLLNGKVLVAGGYDGSTFLASAELYDPVTRSWSATGSLAEARIQHTATLLADGMVLVAGGHNATGHAIAAVELYDPITGTWSSAGDLAQARARGHTATLLQDGTVLVVGGDITSVSFASVELYDPATHTWSTRSSLPASRTGHTATLLPDGTVLIASGMSYPTPAIMFPLHDALLYHPSTDTWENTAAPSELHLHHTATLLQDGTVLIAGGGIPTYSSNRQTTATSEIYNPVLRTWREVGSLATAREGHAATMLADGSVLIIGGAGDGIKTFLASAERYNPVTETWSTAGSRNAPPDWHTPMAMLLADGNVLVIGGTSPTEIYGLYRVRLPLVTIGSS